VVRFALATTEVAKEDAAAINLWWILAFVLALATVAIVFLLIPAARKVAKGKDGRLSTSKFQGVMWTLVVLWALFGLLYALAISRIGGDLLGAKGAAGAWDALSKGFEAFLDDGFEGNYLLLLGFPLAGAISSKAITSSKVASGSVVKESKDDSETTTNAAQELIGDDNGNPDLGDLQYLLFSLLAVAYFLVQFISHPTQGLPPMPDTLVGLTGVAAAAYVSKKGIYSEPPILLGVLPSSAKPGEQVRIYGEKLTSSMAKVAVGGGDQPQADNTQLGAIVTFNGQAAALVGEATDSLIEVTVPDLAPGPVKVAVVRPPGATSEELPFSVLAK
jgi:hypothetical protein